MRRRGLILSSSLLLALSGCASYSTKITGSERSGSEQLLLTGASDQAIGGINFSPIAGAKVYLDPVNVGAVDAGWLIFSLRREMARQGLLLVEGKEEAKVIVEAAIAAYGTDEVNRSVTPPTVSSVGGLPLPSSGGTPAAFSRTNRQDAVVKLALFAYDVATRRLIWESGQVIRTESLDRRFFGTNEYSRHSSLPVLDGYPRR